MDRLTSALKLSKDQRKGIKAALDDAQKEATPIYEQLPKSHLAIAEAIAAGKSQAEIDQAVHHHAELPPAPGELGPGHCVPVHGRVVERGHGFW